MTPIKLDIYHHTDSTSTLKDIGVDYKIEDCEIRPVIFYHINAISPFFDGGKEYCSVHSNGSEYIANAKFEDVQMLLANLYMEL